jgi:hypothetical protein
VHNLRIPKAPAQTAPPRQAVELQAVLDGPRPPVISRIEKGRTIEVGDCLMKRRPATRISRHDDTVE